MAHIHSPFTRQRLSEGEQLADSFYCVIDSGAFRRPLISATHTFAHRFPKHRPIFLYIFDSVPWQSENDFGSAECECVYAKV